MKKLISLNWSLIIYLLTYSQNIIIPVNVANFDTTNPQTLDTRNLKDTERDKFSIKTSDHVIIQFDAIPGGKSISVNDEDIDTTSRSFDLTNDLRDLLSKGRADKRSYQFKLKDKATGTRQVCGSVDITWTKKEVGLVADAKGQANRKKEIARFSKSESFSTPYNYKEDEVHLYFDENGRLLNFLPVNVDQNDIFYMHILCVKGDEEKYRINIVQGDYSPVDLAIRPFEKIVGISDEGPEEKAPIEYSSTMRRAGPFTSEYFRFQIAYDSLGTETVGPEYKLKINKLFHVGVGVSLIRSSLEAPDYKTFYNGTDTTIEAFNGEGRTLFTFNVIWYWTIFHQKNKGSIIPNGRDVLKDEPTFSFTRLFPTLGVTIDEDFKENFFLGVVYEFARGGSFTAGLHYGRVEVLKDKNFVVGQTKFSGTDADIQLDKVYKTGFYFGINVDTRILNLLFSKGQ